MAASLPPGELRGVEVMWPPPPSSRLHLGAGAGHGRAATRRPPSQRTREREAVGHFLPTPLSASPQRLPLELREEPGSDVEKSGDVGAGKRGPREGRAQGCGQRLLPRVEGVVGPRAGRVTGAQEATARG